MRSSLTNYMIDQNKLRFFFAQLKQEDLPGYTAHLELTPYRKNVQPQDIKEDTRNGAVAIIISFHANTPTIILTKRANYDGVHGGQISFPGGKIDEHDLDLKFTAQRECREETGIILESHNFICKLSEIYIPPSNFLVHPFLFITENKFIGIENNEVNYFIEFPLSHLNDDLALKNADIKLFNGSIIKNAPCFIYKNEIIWGATAAILNEMRWIIRGSGKS